MDEPSAFPLWVQEKQKALAVVATWKDVEGLVQGLSEQEKLQLWSSLSSSTVQRIRDVKEQNQLHLAEVESVLDWIAERVSTIENSTGFALVEEELKGKQVEYPSAFTVYSFGEWLDLGCFYQASQPLRTEKGRLLVTYLEERGRNERIPE